VNRWQKGWQTRREHERQERAQFERRSEAARQGWITRRERQLQDRQDRRWSEWDYVEEPIDEEEGDTGEATR